MCKQSLLQLISCLNGIQHNLVYINGTQSSKSKDRENHHGFKAERAEQNILIMYIPKTSKKFMQQEKKKMPHGTYTRLMITQTKQ
jgi:hypothetical protein